MSPRCMPIRGKRPVTDKPSIQVLAICGSLRKASFNRMAMHAAMARAP